MVSLGGLDVAFGSSLQLVRTNVLVIETDGTTTKAMAEAVHSCARKYPATIRPDFTAFVADGALTEGYATVLTDQVEGNILKDITAVPIAGSQRDATGSNNRGMAIEAILNVGVVQINANDTATVDDLFTDVSPTGIEADELHLGHQMQAALMKDVFDNNAPQQTLNLTALLTQSAVLGGTKVTDGLDAITESSTLAALNDGIAGAGAIVSITSLARIL